MVLVYMYILLILCPVLFIGPFGVIRRRCEISQLFLVLMLQVSLVFDRCDVIPLVLSDSTQVLESRAFKSAPQVLEATSH